MSIEKRTKASLAFQSRWADLRPPGTLVPKSTDVELTHFAEFLPLLIKVDVEVASKTMPIQFVGSLIRDIVGTEFTGKNYLDFVENEDAEAGWQSRLPVHDHPCGRFEVVHMTFPGHRPMMGSLTTLPIFGPGNKRSFLVLGEPMEAPPLLSKDQAGSHIAKDRGAVFFDIGAGVPAQD